MRKDPVNVFFAGEWRDMRALRDTLPVSEAALNPSAYAVFRRFAAGVWAVEDIRTAGGVHLSKPRKGVEAWWTLPLGPFAAMPWDAATEARVESALTEEEQRGQFSDPMGFLLRVCEAQRFATDIQRGAGQLSPGVGGFAQVTQIIPAGITTGILKRWNDPLGEKLDPL